MLRAEVADPDHVVHHALPSCSSCGSGLEDAEFVDDDRRQVFEFPQIRLVVTEHIAEHRRCRCGCTTKAEFPTTATAPACYGPSVRALAAYLAVHQHLPMDQIAQLFSDVLRAPVSVRALGPDGYREPTERPGPFLESTPLLLHGAPVGHFDETGGEAVGKLLWVHSASTGRLTLIDCHPKRGRLAMDDLGVIGAMTGVAVHDNWKPYRHYDIDHAFCNAH